MCVWGGVGFGVVRCWATQICVLFATADWLGMVCDVGPMGNMSRIIHAEVVGAMHEVCWMDEVLLMTRVVDLKNVPYFLYFPSRATI